MFSIDYSDTDYSTFINTFATQANAEPNGSLFIIPENIANGYYRHVSLSNGFPCLISNYVLNQDMYFHNRHSNKEFYTIRFDQFCISKNLMIKIDEEYLWEGKQDRAFAFMTSTLLDYAYLASKGSQIKSINILIPREYLAKYFDLEKHENLLKKYLILNTETYNLASFDGEYRLLFNAVTSNSHNGELINSEIDSNIKIMIERFLSQLKQKLSFFKERDKIKIRYDEVKRLMEVELCLVKDFSTAPPSIAYLSKVGAMSSTTLKTKFKKLYGNTLHEYFQKRRMQKARVLLLTRKYSIKEIGILLGYSNLSNFTIAFKKEFNKLPRESCMQI